MGQSPNIEIIDVTARDGLQNETVLLSTAAKIDLITQTIRAGASRLEVASFAHPKYVPQMADAEAVIAALPEADNVTYIGLAMNERGVERALKTNINEVGLVAVATDGFGQKNQGQTREESVDVACAMIETVKASGRQVNVTISTAFGCPFEGEVPIETVVDMAKKLASVGPREIALADTIGVANPWHVHELFSAVKTVLPDMPLRAHFHNTRNTGLANIYAAIEAGVRRLDVSIGGIGGCPFAPNATGNVPAEDVIYMLGRNDFETGMNLAQVIETAKWLSEPGKRLLIYHHQVHLVTF